MPRSAKGQQEAERGRVAERPQEIPAPGWRDILLRVWGKIGELNLSMFAAGVAYYGLFAIFPALVAAVSIYGLVADPADVERQVGALSGVLPQEAANLITGQLHRISATSSDALSVGLLGGVLLALWSAASGVKALITALNVSYGESERRGFLHLNAAALLLTLGAIVFAVLSLALIVALPALLGNLGIGGLGEIGRIVISVSRWPLLALVILLGLAVLYRYGPSRDQPRWRWVSWGAAVAAVLWLVASALFSFYVSNFGNYNKTYGSIGAVVILLLWFYLTAFIVLLGAALNAEMEHQTKKDTTKGQPEPLGKRRAHVADTLGKSP